VADEGFEDRFWRRFGAVVRAHFEGREIDPLVVVAVAETLIRARGMTREESRAELERVIDELEAMLAADEAKGK
jgi:hypothetical protein